MGAARSTSTFIAQSGLPNSTVATIPTTMRNGAEGVFDPGPTSCQARVYDAQTSRAPSGTGRSAPPCRTPSPHHSPRVAMAATTNKAMVATTPGARRTRRRTPEESSGRYAASSSIGPDSRALTLVGPVAELVVSRPPTASPTSRNWSTEVGRSDRATDAGSTLDRETSDRDAVTRRGFASTANCALTSSRAAAKSLPTR